MTARRPGQVIGRAGGSLEDGHNDWAANADVARQGRAGEVRTASVLNAMAIELDGPTVLHDLVVPGSRANIDHVVVTGRDVVLVDSKQWKPGFYWTVLGRTFRGAKPFPYADKATMSMAYDKVREHLRARGVRARLRRPVVVVWSSARSGEPRTALLRMPGARAVPGSRARSVIGRVRPAEPEVVAALAELAPKPKRSGPPRSAPPRRQSTW